MVTREDVFRMMEECGLQSTDTVIVHSSLRSIGEIEGGADGLIDDLKAYLSDGLLLIPTHTWGSVGRKNPFYDVRSTVPCIGTLPTVAAFRPDGVRSLHPTHSVAAFGKKAAEYVKGDELCGSPAPPHGCMGRLYDVYGKVLLLGVGLNRNTYMHAVDERMKLPNRLIQEPFFITITDWNGNSFQSVPFRHHRCTDNGEIVHAGELFPNFKAAFEEAGVVVYSHLGNALVYCLDVHMLDDVMRAIWAKADHDIGLHPEELHWDGPKLK